MSDILQKNLEALRRVDATLARELDDVERDDGVTFVDSKQPPAVSATLEVVDEGGTARRITLASRFAPIDEAKRLADTADLNEHAVIVVLGFGLGYHVAQLADRLGDQGMLVIVEPSERLLRSVLERVDHSGWLGGARCVWMVGEVGAAEVTQRLERHSPLIGQGVQFVMHPPTRQLHAEGLKRFTDHLSQFVAYCRTNLATAMVNSPRTCENLANNLGRYAAGSTIDELRDAAAGYPAVLVSAGPSLARNVHRLTEPGVRDRVVIIAVQTTLKPLLDRGVRPHFVTALDYHEISRQFYEGLPRLDDVTLIADPKANKTILDQYPGPVRTFASNFLDTLLGEMRREMDALRSGSTVAHLSVYLAQYLGCDPIVLIGQDLGFSDGLYYCPGTAIHDVWAPELNAFNTLEMMEWRRIARHKAHLHRLEDQSGKPIFSDEQMITYLRQFERDFADAGQTVIDATEGGLPKAHTTMMSLGEALAAHATHPLPTLPEAASALDGDRLAAGHEHLSRRREELVRLRQVTEKTIPLLKKMMRDQRNHAKMNVHFEALNRHQRHVAEVGDVFGLVNELNQTGAFKRQRADRAIAVTDDMDDYERQKRQLERDVDNLRWLLDASDEAMRIFGAAAQRIEDQLATAGRAQHEVEAAQEVTA
ncbi:MAG: hypothetical protein CMJ49_14565 [Planctomycetaceae bacterium]|nr:hypothetical protein [Planctomycetaceae bacterium]